jgi:hypothetical protein
VDATATGKVCIVAYSSFGKTRVDCTALGPHIGQGGRPSAGVDAARAANSHGSVVGCGHGRRRLVQFVQTREDQFMTTGPPAQWSRAGKFP